jgi:hypothetical protein
VGIAEYNYFTKIFNICLIPTRHNSINLVKISTFILYVVNCLKITKEKDLKISDPFCINFFLQKQTVL